MTFAHTVTDIPFSCLCLLSVHIFLLLLTFFFLSPVYVYSPFISFFFLHFSFLLLYPGSFFDNLFLFVPLTMVFFYVTTLFLLSFFFLSLVTISLFIFLFFLFFYSLHFYFFQSFFLSVFHPLSDIWVSPPVSPSKSHFPSLYKTV